MQLKEWTPNSRYGGHAFGFMDPNDLKLRDTRFAEFLAHREEILPWIKEYSPIEHVTADDPPVYLIYSSPPAWAGTKRSDAHVKLRCEASGKMQKRRRAMRACLSRGPRGETRERHGISCRDSHARRSALTARWSIPAPFYVKHQTMEAYIIESLKATTAKSAATK